MFQAFKEKLQTPKFFLLYLREQVSERRELCRRCLGARGGFEEINGEDVGMEGVGLAVLSGYFRGEAPNPPSGGKGD